MIHHGRPPYLECSSKGDPRFSAFHARIRARGNQSIEDIYQAAKVFDGGVTGLSWRGAKGKIPVNILEVRALYSQLWDEYIVENWGLLPVLCAATGLSDVFGQPGSACQATELWRIRCRELDARESFPDAQVPRPPATVSIPPPPSTTVRYFYHPESDCLFTDTVRPAEVGTDADSQLCVELDADDYFRRGGEITHAQVPPPPRAVIVPPPPVTVPPPPPTASWVPTVPVSIPELPPPPQVVYDEETYPNFFCLVARAMESDQTWTFEISPRRNDLLGLLAWIDDLSRRGVEMIGFNNLGFDYPVLHEIIVNPQCRTPDAIYQKAMSIIRGQGDNRFGSMVWESDRRVPQLDLFKIHHFDNKAKSTGLKALQFAMRSDSVEDLPFPVGIMLTPQQMDVTLRYCLHDVTETKKFAEKSRESIELRRALTTKYKRNFMNHNDTKIGKDYLIMRLGEEVCYTRDPSTGKRAPRQTLRPTIALGDVILPYVRFSHPGFNAVLGWLRRQVITETKGVFGNIDVQDEGKAFGVDLNHENVHDLPHYADPSTVKTTGDKLRMTKLNCRVNEFTFVFGTGGIHGSVENTIVESDDEYSIWDWDVESYYPNLAIKNRLYPEHLGEAFCDDYEDVFQQRKQFKKGTPENAVMKLALNGTYGDSNNPYSPFYDPKFTMAITINGQLLLCMLAEQLFNVPDLQLIQINTDGLTIRIPRRHEWLMHEICRWWQSVTKLSLENVQYRKMNILNVNNYQAVTLDGKAKLKGAYLVKRGWHQDQSALIVPMAAEAVMVKGASLEEFIRLHTDPFDFMCRAKAPRGSRLMIGDRQTQNTLRYYVSTDGQPLTKVSPPVEGAVEGQYKRKNGVSEQVYREWHATNGNVWNPEFHTGNKSVYATRIMSICSGWRITECNVASQFSWNNLDYQWYIDEAKKLIIGHDHLLGSPV